MKCDELETEQWLDYGGEPMPCYPAKDVDEAIDEMKQKLHDAEMAKDDAEAANTEYREDIRKLKAENDRLRDDNDRIKKLNEIVVQELESKRWIDYNRRAALRALWMARARAAIGKQAYYDILSCNVSDRSEMIDVWHKVEQLCIKKAEEYK